MLFIGLNESIEVVGIWCRIDLVRMFANIEVILFAIAKSCFPILILFDAGNTVKRITIVF